MDFQQAQFPVAQGETIFRRLQFGGQRIQRDITNHQILCCAGPDIAAKNCPAAGLQLGKIKGFDDIVISPEIQHIHPVRHF